MKTYAKTLKNRGAMSGMTPGGVSREITEAMVIPK